MTVVRDFNMSHGFNILFLDDNEQRTAHFLSCISYAKTAETAAGMIDLIKSQSGPIDFLFLDHDLGGEIFVDTEREDTGAEVARWLSDNKHSIQPIRVVIIHTHNDVGGEKMLNILKAAYFETVEFLPFKCQDFNKLVDQISRADNGRNSS